MTNPYLLKNSRETRRARSARPRGMKSSTNPIKSTRQGTMPVVIVLVFAGIMLFTTMFTFRTGRDHRQISRRAALEFQAQYLAVAAVQHAELKIRFFPTELYDASEYSLGKNPYFDFSEIPKADYDKLSALRQAEYVVSPRDPSYYLHLASSFNPGPRLISDGTLASDSDKWFQLAQLDAADSDPINFAAKASIWFPSGWPKIDNKEVRNSDLYLWKFISDVTTDAALQPALNCVRDPNFDIGTLNSLPFDCGYRVISVKVLTMKEHRRLNQEVVKIVTQGWVTDPQTKITVTVNLEKTIKVSRQ